MDISKAEIIKTYVEGDTHIYAIKLNDKKYVIKSGKNFMIDSEANILKMLDHPNIIRLEEHVQEKYMVLEYMDEDLRDYISRNENIDRLLVKSYMWQLLSGLEYCHKNNISHLDIKPENLLINNNGDLKIADFGFSRVYKGEFTSFTIGTSGYRPPNVLLGSNILSCDVDIWAAGCVFGELLFSKFLFDVDGNDSDEEMTCIFNVLGSPNQSDLRYFKNMRSYSTFMKEYNSDNVTDYDKYIKHRISQLDNSTHNLLMSLLQYNPRHRLSAKEALQHPYFYELHQLGCV
ncbi:Negative regulator of the PHO system [Orpheovirus IHUMI-LCC2]|uniref:Negative regulator of the PHO system n=1 Tax=Orpheovirus IHUMI-LCC2 TaxID=2023057 RepID=A0A2I2L576_9VIRU|nr:Negative regulator of the PHO system [Orpheovirus IHUMI-LCC2]SNW62609.1 Negative regulator of the PHO system [Orpheovirus IHUMI-LCC2]